MIVLHIFLNGNDRTICWATWSLITDHADSGDVIGDGFRMRLSPDANRKYKAQTMKSSTKKKNSFHRPPIASRSFCSFDHWGT